MNSCAFNIQILINTFETPPFQTRITPSWVTPVLRYTQYRQWSLQATTEDWVTVCSKLQPERRRPTVGKSGAPLWSCIPLPYMGIWRPAQHGDNNRLRHRTLVSNNTVFCHNWPDLDYDLFYIWSVKSAARFCWPLAVLGSLRTGSIKADAGTKVGA